MHRHAVPLPPWLLSLVACPLLTVGTLLGEKPSLTGGTGKVACWTTPTRMLSTGGISKWTRYVCMALVDCGGTHQVNVYIPLGGKVY